MFVLISDLISSYTLCFDFARYMFFKFWIRVSAHLQLVIQFLQSGLRESICYAMSFYC